MEAPLLVLERIDDGQEVRERPPKTVQLPDNQYIACLHEVQRLGQTGTVILRPGRVVREEMPGIDAR